MTIIEALNERQSVRGFLPDPVPRETIEKILAAAVRAPSAENIQPWEFTVITGEPLRKISAENVMLLENGVPPDPGHASHRWPKDSAYRQRQVAVGKELFRLMNIDRDDKEKRAEWIKRGFRYFDAPAAVVISYDRMIPPQSALFDIGCLAQSLCLAALEYGVVTCIQYQGVMYAAPLREYADIPENKENVIAIAMGYPDNAYPANALRTERDPVEDITSWVGF